MKRPGDNTQAGRILRLLESTHGRKVSLLEILGLHISQYSARIHDLRHKYGFKIENGSEPGRPDHTWFRLLAPERSLQDSLRAELETGEPAGLFPTEELERGAPWRDEG